MRPSAEVETWELPILGFRLVEVQFGGRIGIVTYGTRSGDERHTPSAKLSFGGGFILHDDHGVQHNLDATAPWDSLTPLFALRHKVVASAVADAESHIEIGFDNGARLAAGPVASYKNWELVGPGSLKLVAMPSGDPRISGDLG
jgi:Family of unknown function (DUF6188)